MNLRDQTNWIAGGRPQQAGGKPLLARTQPGNQWKRVTAPKSTPLAERGSHAQDPALSQTLPSITQISPTVISLRSVAVVPGTSCDWHSHGFYEFTLCMDDSSTVGHADKLRQVPANTLFLWPPGIKHCYQASPTQSPRFLVIHFSCPTNFSSQRPAAFPRRSETRFWSLGPAQAESFRWSFLRLFSEQHFPDEISISASSLRLYLLLLDVERWTSHGNRGAALPSVSNPELIGLWKMVNDCGERPEQFTQKIRSIPNYDSLRHAFKKAFGRSPTQMVDELMIHHAKHLLLETKLNIKEIASRMGYDRQHVFSRAFQRRVGVAPTDWRNNPTP